MLTSCRENPNDKSGNAGEGEIVYKITYDKDFEDHHFSFLYPEEMTLFFKDNCQRLCFKGAKGLYSFEFIYGNELDTVFTMLKIPLFQKKLVVPTCGKNLFIFSELPHERITVFLDDTKEIAGLIAKKATLKSIYENVPDIEIWYSDEIPIEEPNKYTPFHKILGVPLESKIIYNNVSFNFKAHKITSKKISEDIFKAPTDYKLTTIEEIEELLLTVF